MPLNYSNVFHVRALEDWVTLALKLREHSSEGKCSHRDVCGILKQELLADFTMGRTFADSLTRQTRTTNGELVNKKTEDFFFGKESLEDVES